MRMHPSKLNISSQGRPEGACFADSLLETFCFESSQPQLKRFIMVDQSGGKNRVFVHASLANELLSSHGQSEGYAIGNTRGVVELPCELLQPSDEEEANARLLAFRQTVTTAFSSLQALRDNRRVNVASPWTNTASSPLQPVSSYSSGTKRVSVAASGSVKEDTEDLDALLSSDDEDEEVMSTAHSSEDDQSTGESAWSEEEEGEGRKRQKLEKDQGNCRKEEEADGEEEEADGEEEEDVEKTESSNREGIARRLRIKRTVKSLRNIIPGGSCRNAALVLEETILYVKVLRDRVNQLEATSSIPK